MRGRSRCVVGGATCSYTDIDVTSITSEDVRMSEMKRAR